MSRAVAPAGVLEEHRVEGPHGGKPIKQWTKDEVIQWVKEVGFEDCAQVFQAHSVSGLALPRLHQELLAEMGIASVGRRMLLVAEITKLQALDRAHWRGELVWQGEEYRPGPCNGVLPFGFPCCFEFSVGKPALYKLTNSKFNVTQWIKNVNFPGCGCCGYTMTSDSLDLVTVTDIDTIDAGTSCLGDPPGYLVINTRDNKQHPLSLQSSQCQKVSAILANSKEEAVIQQGLMQFGRA